MNPVLIAGIALTMAGVAALVVLRRAGGRDNMIYGRELDGPDSLAGPGRRPNARMIVVIVALIIVGGVAGFLSAGAHH